MRIDFLTLFPELFKPFFETSIIKRAVSKKVVSLRVSNIRDFTLDKNYRVDDYPLGGGAGLVMKCQPILDCLKTVRKEESKVIYLSPKGQVFNQKMAKELSKEKHLILLCGHYEGIDERVLKQVNLEISLGDYILTGGELPAMVLADAVIRLLDGAISEDSLDIESFDNGLLEYPQYTFPRVYEGAEVPPILLCGNHEAIKKWRLKEQLKETMKKRPDLLVGRKYSKLELSLLKEIEKGEEEPAWYLEALEKGKKFLD
ncbi:tRNA (guanosine(37)-N1)-methyltransferase TrmD [bacterium]|jgi:tRNA (guanine37-N1)-methyltransferase|nr:tRNA (guanosine(37)-N1)-methyltransferase TrmD [bacterium]